MNARALLAWSASALVVVLSTSNPVYRGVVALCALNLILARGAPGARLRPLFIGMGIATVLATLVSMFLSHTGTHALFALPSDVPLLGGAVTFESAVSGLSTGLGIVAAVLAAAPLTLVSEPHELVSALPRALARTGAAIGAALNVMPGLARSAVEISDAQRMRGWRARRVRDWPDVAVPVVLTAVEGSLALAEAMEARGYGAGARTHYTVQRWTRWDVVIVIASTIAAAAFAVLRILGVAGDWYPYPVVAWPQVSVAALACCAVFVLPSLGRARVS